MYDGYIEEQNDSDKDRFSSKLALAVAEERKLYNRFGSIIGWVGQSHGVVSTNL